MTGHGDIPMTVRVMKAGAADFLSKQFRDQDMLDAVATAIMAFVTAGLMNKQIAAEMGLSEIT